MKFAEWIFSIADSPTDTRLTSDLTTVLRGNTLILNCSADANPMVHIYFLYFNGYQISNSSQGMFRVSVKADSVYTCVPENTVGSGDKGNITIIVIGKFIIITKFLTEA